MPSPASPGSSTAIESALAARTSIMCRTVHRPSNRLPNLSASPPGLGLTHTRSHVMVAAVHHIASLRLTRCQSDMPSACSWDATDDHSDDHDYRGGRLDCPVRRHQREDPDGSVPGLAVPDLTTASPGSVDIKGEERAQNSSRNILTCRRQGSASLRLVASATPPSRAHRRSDCSPDIRFA
jgi:hypothetical protein